MEGRNSEILSGKYSHTDNVQMDTVQLPTSHSQRLNSGKSPGTGRCEWLWAVGIAPIDIQNWTADRSGEGRDTRGARDR